MTRESSPYLRAVRGGLEASGEGPRGDEPLAVAEVVLKRELHGVGLGGPGGRRVRGSAAGGGRRSRGWGWGGGTGAEALELVVVVEEQLVGLEGGGEEGGGEGGGEEGEEQETAARRGHGFAAATLEWTWRERDVGQIRQIFVYIGDSGLGLTAGGFKFCLKKKSLQFLIVNRDDFFYYI